MRKIIKRLTVLFVAAVVAVFALFGTACDKKDSSLEFIEEGKSVSYTKAKNFSAAGALVQRPGSAGFSR